MNVTFKSIINQNGEKNVIEFTEPLILSEYDGFNVYEFKEPSAGINNRIEVSQMAVNIFNGPSSINLILDKETVVLYESPGMQPLQFQAYMSFCDGNKDNPTWTYTLKNGNQLIGEYTLSLKIK